MAHSQPQKKNTKHTPPKQNNNMTPQEAKAKELVEKMYQTCSVTIAGTASIFRDIAKSLALIAVNEIMDDAETGCLLVCREYSETSHFEFWQLVKEAIKKL